MSLKQTHSRFVPGSELQSLAAGRPASESSASSIQGIENKVLDGRQAEGGHKPRAANSAGSEAYVAQAGRTRKKAKIVGSACTQCQKRKTKCSGHRPVCMSCNEHSLECIWDVTDSATRTADRKRKLVETKAKNEALDQLVEKLRSGTDEQSTMLLAKLRLGSSIDDLLQSRGSVTMPTDCRNMSRAGSLQAAIMSGRYFLDAEPLQADHNAEKI